jgi:hypothetical protein
VPEGTTPFVPLTGIAIKLVIPQMVEVIGVIVGVGLIVIVIKLLIASQGIVLSELIDILRY